tara:strand:- start:21 stop:347 length:327 start_codon:yes stop_codon:yes gene_type:complete
MTRRRYIQDPRTHELIEVTTDYASKLTADAGALWGDRSYDGMRATDGTDIGSRSKQREYMRANNLTTADDFKDTWAQAREKRERYATGGGSFSRADVERAIHEVTNRR